MFSKFFVLLLATLTSSAFADPAVFYCTDVNWSGNCHQSPITVDQEGVCRNLKDDVARFNDAISSFGPDEDLHCTVFKDFDCPTNNLYNYAAIEYPGYADLRTIGWNDVISSYTCYPY
ncbi:hypothetical protein BDN72DRAFT_855753 [Pluteus cervinus]|uniref:Uncharacterized protein n=1 Tax=Pluteus cervinus TaxID=181527 RepID=A0ACD3B3E5_9AGAR|nr:hypothetical protein BDN72DRAFT_855753 [Pluteus cervinus]